MEWKNIYRGILMGISDLIPGVSGGTIAFILGIYDRLLEAISGFFSREWKKQLGFLVPLGFGVVLTLLLLSRVIEYFLEEHYEPTQFFFMGLIIGVVPYIMKQAEVKKNFTARHFITLLVIGAALASMAFIQTNENAAPMTALSIPVFFTLFFSGWLASMAMLLPGISGSFILLLLGVYSTAINALSTFNLPIVLTIGAGVIVGFIISSKAITYLLARFTHITYAAIIGLILGSLFVVFPGFSADAGTLIASIVTFIAGLVFTLLISSPKKTDITDGI